MKVTCDKNIKIDDTTFQPFISMTLQVPLELMGDSRAMKTEEEVAIMIGNKVIDALKEMLVSE